VELQFCKMVERNYARAWTLTDLNDMHYAPAWSITMVRRRGNGSEMREKREAKIMELLLTLEGQLQRLICLVVEFGG